MTTFPRKFHELWNKYFELSPINEVTPILGTRNAKNLQQRLVYNRHHQSSLLLHFSASYISLHISSFFSIFSLFICPVYSFIYVEP